jgi:uncharacterized membrane-anchored protein YhcB (DUF1043 family)
MSSNYSIAQDLKEAVAMAEGLEEYVRGTELYGNAGGGFFANLPSLTIGALVMRLRRLEALRDKLNQSQQASLDAALRHYEHVQKEWNVHFSEKIVKEANSRLDAMRTFFNECAKSSTNCAGNYAPEVLRRTIVQELLPVIEHNRAEAEGLQDKLRQTDGKLRGIVRSAPFSWAAELQSVYPQEAYWWLYQRPPQD